MVVHNDCPGLTAEVIVDGKALPEYEDTDTEGAPHETIRYVEARTDSKFAVSWSFNKGFKSKRAMAVSVSVDGVRLNGRVVTTRELRSHTKEASGMADHVQKKEGNRWFKQELRFSTLDVVDDTEMSTMQRSVDSVRKIGDITVSVESGRRGRTINAKNSDTRAAHDGTSRVSEKLLKGSVKSLRASFVDDQSIALPKRTRWTKSTKDPIYLFTFKYRTKANLQALHILPRSPSPSPAIQADSTQTVVQASDPRTGPEPRDQLDGHPPYSDTPATASATSNVDIARGLRVEEIIAMIAVYRGGSDGLAGQSKRSLAGLLRFYEDRDKEATPTKSEPAAEGNGNVNIKRERESGASAREGQKRSKRETIVLD